MNTRVQKKLSECMAPALAKLDDTARQVVQDLTQLMRPAESIYDNDDQKPTHVATCVCFPSRLGSVFITQLFRPVENFMEKTVQDLKCGQFTTRSEDSIYCSGTVGLLELLTKYRYQRTEKATIMSIPTSRIREEVGGKRQAYIHEYHLDAYYGKERQVSVIVVMDDGFVQFGFEQKHNRANAQW